MIIGLKMWPLEHTQGFSKILTCDLVFDPTWTIFELIRDFIRTNLLTNFHDNQTENVDSREYTSQNVSERNNFEVGLLCSYVPSCDPRGGANTDPRGIIWTNLVEVHKEMLQTKYQALRLPVSEKNFEVCCLCFYVPTCDPWDWSILTPGASHEQIW